MFNLFKKEKMKRFRILSVLLFFVNVLIAQDVITKTDGEDITAKVIEVGKYEVRYKQFNNLEGPTFVLDKSEILMIRFENGTKEIFSSTTRQPMRNNQYYDTRNQYGNREVYYDIRPGMKYAQYQKYYNVSEYVPMPGDRYSPALSGVCSFLIPGLGQMISGEVGRGLGWFLGSVAACTLSTVWLTNTDPNWSYGAWISGAVVGPISIFTINIASIVDAVRVAKKKNMYLRDINNVSSLDFSISPYFSFSDNIPGVKAINPNAGVTMKLNF